MPCTITITALYTNESPIQSQVVTAKPSVATHFQLVGGVWSEVQYGYLSAVTDATGTATLSLPWPSVCDPSTIQWVITDPTGAKYVGTVPQGVSGPLTLKTLKDTYGWGLAGVDPYVSPVVAIQGPAGASSDATTGAVGVVLVDHAPSGAHPVALTTDSTTMPAGLLGAHTWTGTQVMNGGVAVSVTSQSGNYTVSATDSVIIATAVGKTITLPTASSAGTGRRYCIKNTAAGGGTLIVATSYNATGPVNAIDGAASFTSSQPGQSVDLVSDGSNYWLI
jgi:hypothetical protein